MAAATPAAPRLQDLSETQKQELMVTYACLILHDDGAPITPENINKLVAAAGSEVAPYWPKMFADLLKGKDVNELLMNAGGGGGGGGGAQAGGAAGGDAGEAKEEEKEEEEEEESDADMGFSLFD
jgi:large subunit ribosomal protein LP1